MSCVSLGILSRCLVKMCKYIEYFVTLGKKDGIFVTLHLYMNRFILLATLCLVCLASSAQNPRDMRPPENDTPQMGRRSDAPAIDGSLSYSWKLLSPMGLREIVPMDTLPYNYFRTAVPSGLSPAFATTGNQASAGKNMIYLDRDPASDFFLLDAKRFWLPSVSKMRFYNTRVPMTLLSYNMGGGREIAQDYLKMVFSGNINKKAQIGALLDYPYSKGSYNNQASKGLTWGLSGSYIGDRYEFQGFFNHFNMINKENGGITDDLYILDPAQLQGGVSSINPKSIPTNLSASHSRVKGQQFYMNHRYKVGYWHEERDDNDSIVSSEYIPVSSFIWTFDYNDAAHSFSNTNAQQEKDFWTNHYFNLSGTYDVTKYSSIRNTLGISLLEGFNKYAKAGLAAFLTHELRSYTLPTDTLPISEGVRPGDPDRPADLTPYPFEQKIKHKEKENLLWVGAQLVKQKGALLRYDITAQLGLLGPAIGEIKVDGVASSRFKLLGDSVTISAFGHFSNLTAPYLMNHFISNHFAWENDFGKTRRLRFGGTLDIPHTWSRITAAAENVQNLIYFSPEALPVQAGGSVQVVSVKWDQAFRYKALNWVNTVVWQKSSDEAVIPLPQLAVYSNLYLAFKVAGVLSVQLGVDMDYYTRYKAPSYQPSLMTFCNQREKDCGNYPFMNAYANFKLSKARFFIVYTHANQGLFGGNDYFSIPHYPLNPRRLQMGVSVDFIN